MKRKIKVLLELVLYVVFILGLAWVTPKALVYFMGTEYPVASITSGSMWPALKKGDIVFIKHVDNSELQIGDIIVYRNFEELSGQNIGFTIHRIIEINEDTVITKGDANNVQDVPVEYDRIVGRTINWKEGPVRIPRIGNITIWISQNK